MSARFVLWLIALAARSKAPAVLNELFGSGAHSLAPLVAQVGWLLINKLGSRCKEAASTLFEVLYRHTAGRTGQNHENHVSQVGLVV